MFGNHKQKVFWCIGIFLVCSVGLPGQSKMGYFRLMQGPVLGAVDQNSALIWVRGSYAFPVTVECSTDPEFLNSLKEETAQLDKANDYCAVIRIAGLEPGTRYYYRVLIGGRPDRYLSSRMPYAFRTAPELPFTEKFKVAFGSCARYQRDPHQLIWDVIREHQPDMFFWLGDNIYGDSLDSDIIAEEYRRQREIPRLRALMASVPQLAIWDDHDYGLNNHDRSNPVKEDMLKVFQRYWPNPAFGQSDNPGVYFSIRYGNVDFFFLDGRYYRNPNKEPDAPGKTQLGEVQFNWLLDGLKKSEATFKVLISGGGWSDVKGAGSDSWGGHQIERNRIFDFIRDENISGVVLLSGDTHFAELNAIPRSEQGGYDLYDLVSSPLAQRPFTSWLYQPFKKRVRVPFSQSTNFGLIEFDLGREKLTFNVYGIDGRPAWEPFTLEANELTNGQSTWEEKTTRNARRWNAVDR